jgi:hypothetical protein
VGWQAAGLGYFVRPIWGSVRRSAFFARPNALAVVFLKENAAWSDGFGDYSTALEMKRLMFRVEFATAKRTSFF